MTLAYHHGANARKRERCRDHKTDCAGVRRRGKLLDLVRLRVGLVGAGLGLGLALAVDVLVSLAFAAIVIVLSLEAASWQLFTFATVSSS